MSEFAYKKLREFLDQFPRGFPETESGVEIKILKRLFTELEAETTLFLTPMLEEVSIIAERAGMETGDLEEILESMSKKGLIFRVRREGKTIYKASPFMIGFYEHSVKKIDRELASLYKEYYESAYLEEMSVSNVPGFKVIPVERTLPRT